MQCPARGAHLRSYVMGNGQRLSPITDLSCLTQYDFLTLFWKFQKIPWFVWATRDSLPKMQETQVWSLGREDPLEKEMATHSSTLAYKIPWMEEPGGLQSMGSQRVGHDLATKQQLQGLANTGLLKWGICKLKFAHYSSVLRVQVRHSTKILYSLGKLKSSCLQADTLMSEFSQFLGVFVINALAALTWGVQLL